MEIAKPYLKENAQILDPFCGVGVIGIECVIAVVFWCIAYALFNKGTQVYESAGN